MAGVRQLRESIKVTQTEFASLIGKSAQMVQRYERAVAPTREILAKLVGIARDRGLPELAKLFRDGIAEELGDEVTNTLLYGEWQEQRRKHFEPQPGLPDSDQKLIESAAEALRSGGLVAERLRDTLDPGRPHDRIEAQVSVGYPQFERLPAAARIPLGDGSGLDARMPRTDPPGLSDVAGEFIMGDSLAPTFTTNFDRLIAEMTAKLADTAVLNTVGAMAKLGLIEFPKELTPEQMAELLEIWQILRDPTSREEKSAAQSLKVALNARRKAQQKAPGEGEKHRRHKAV